MAAVEIFLLRGYNLEGVQVGYLLKGAKDLLCRKKVFLKKVVERNREVLLVPCHPNDIFRN